MTVKLRLQRWQCRNEACERKTFVEQLPEVAAPLARRTERAAEIIYLFGHGVGGRPGERLIKRIGMPTSDDTILRCLKRRVKARRAEEALGSWASMIGPGARAPLMGPSSWTWSGGRCSIYFPNAPRHEPRTGSSGILTSRSSAAIAAVHSPRARTKARRRRGKSPTASISCRTCARPFRRNSAVLPDFPRVLCCRRDGEEGDAMIRAATG